MSAATSADKLPIPRADRLVALSLALLCHAAAASVLLRDTPAPATPPAVLPAVMVALIPAPQPVLAQAPAPVPEAAPVAEPPPPPPPKAEPPKPKPKPKPPKPKSTPKPPPPKAIQPPAPKTEPEPAEHAEPAPTAPPQLAAAAPSAGPAKPAASPVTGTPAAGEPIVQANYRAGYLNNPKPLYPNLSRRMGEQGTVKLRVRVGADGNVLAVRLESSSGYPRLDESALKTVPRWRFVPAKRGDIAIESEVIVPIPFILKGNTPA